MISLDTGALAALMKVHLLDAPIAFSRRVEEQEELSVEKGCI